MEKLQYRLRGFGAVGIVTVIVSLLALCVIGYVVVDKRFERNSADAAANTAPPTTSPKSNNTNPTAAKSTESGTTLVVKEWGLQLTLPAAVKDAYYVPSISSQGGDGVPNMIFVGLKSLDSGKCKATGSVAAATPVSTLLRVAPGERDPVKGELYTDLYRQSVQVGDFYYIYSGWHRAGGDNRNACGNEARRNEVDRAFNAAIKTAKQVDAASIGN